MGEHCGCGRCWQSKRLMRVFSLDECDERGQLGVRELRLLIPTERNDVIMALFWGLALLASVETRRLRVGLERRPDYAAFPSPDSEASLSSMFATLCQFSRGPISQLRTRSYDARQIATSSDGHGQKWL